MQQNLFTSFYFEIYIHPTGLYSLWFVQLIKSLKYDGICVFGQPLLLALLARYSMFMLVPGNETERECIVKLNEKRAKLWIYMEIGVVVVLSKLDRLNNGHILSYYISFELHSDSFHSFRSPSLTLILSLPINFTKLTFSVSLRVAP